LWFIECEPVAGPVRRRRVERWSDRIQAIAERQPSSVLTIARFALTATGTAISMNH
jgi:hypothetical protein